jgi:predicted AAA+ superfamily ATPase
LRQSSESLAGRIVYHELGGFSLDEVGTESIDRLWLRGGFPRSYLARSERESLEWREAFTRTFLERDLPSLGFTLPATTLQRFWTMLAHYHGQTWNASEFGRSFGVSDTTVRRYLDILTSAFVVRQLQPWHANVKKRQVKAPKVYVADSGLLHALLGLRTHRDLAGHPKIGASWEGFLLQQVVRRLGVRFEDCHYWATHSGAELDLLVVRGGRRYGFEMKRTEAPSITRSMRSALEDLELTRLDVVHAGAETFPLEKRVRALAAADLLSELGPLR